jgi:hypothetical protein
MITLDQLAAKHGADKCSGQHGYARYYQRLWERVRAAPIRLLEIGVLHGASLRMWSDFFPAAEVVGLDSNESCARHAGGRVKIVAGRQEDRSTAERLAADFPLGFDIVIDDGGHVSAAQIASLEMLFPLVRGGGWYVIEDLHAGYWPCYGGGGRGSIIQGLWYAFKTVLRTVLERMKTTIVFSLYVSATNPTPSA